MVQQVKVPTVNPDYVSLILRIHVLEKTDSCKLSSDFHTCTLTPTHAYTYTHKKIKMQ